MTTYEAPPQWAQELTLSALLYAKEQDKRRKVSVPLLKWEHKERYGSSGSCWIKRGEILIRAGTDRTDTKLILLHELAHHITHQTHTAAMYDMAWKLYRWAKLPIRYCKEREGNYMKGAMVAYHKGLSKTKLERDNDR